MVSFRGWPGALVTRRLDPREACDRGTGRPLYPLGGWSMGLTTRVLIPSLVLSVLLVMPAVSLVGGPDPITGPIRARVLRVFDGDTLVVRARIWLGQEVETRVRLEGVDAPELRGRCARERDLAASARDFVEERIGGGEVTLREIQYGKYAGRVVARVETEAGEDLTAILIAAHLGRPYGGGGRESWCAGERAG